VTSLRSTAPPAAPAQSLAILLRLDSQLRGDVAAKCPACTGPPAHSPARRQDRALGRRPRTDGAIPALALEHSSAGRKDGVRSRSSIALQLPTRLACFHNPPLDRRAMAPSATETVTSTLRSLSIRPEDDKPTPLAPEPTSTKRERPRWFSETAKLGDAYPYERFLPIFDRDLKLPPLEPFEHVDPGHEALKDPTPRSFLDGADVDELTPEFGSEVEGVQLHTLDSRGRQQLALYVAERGVVVFRDQDFHDQEPEWLLHDWTTFFGRPHIHPCSGSPEGYPEFHLVYRDGKAVYNYEVDTRLTSSVWHSDVRPSLLLLLPSRATRWPAPASTADAPRPLDVGRAGHLRGAATGPHRRA